MKKLISAITALSLMATMLFTGISAAAEETTANNGWIPYDDLTCQDNMTYVPNEGIDGSNAFKLTFGQWQSGNLQNGTGIKLENSTEYVVSFRAKRLTDFTWLKVGITDGSWTLSAREFTPADIPLGEFGDTLFAEFTTRDDIASNWNWFLAYGHSANGTAQVVFDDVRIEKKSAPGINLLIKGSGDAYYTESSGTGESGTAYIPAKIEEYTGISSSVGTGVDLYNKGYEIVPGGFNNSYALKLAGTGSAVMGHYSCGGYIGVLKGNTEYVLSFKAKKVGTVTSATVAMTEAWGSIINAKLTLNDAALSTEWHTYTATVVTADGAEKNWNHVTIEANVPVGSEIYFDDICAYEKGDETKKNVLNGKVPGSFDYKYYSEECDNTVKTNVDYTSYPLTAYNGIDFLDNGNTQSDTYAAISEKGEGANGSYALKITAFDDQQHTFSLRIGKNILKNSTSYLVRFKARKATEDTGVYKLSAGLNKRWAASDTQFNIWADDGLLLTDEYRLYYAEPLVTPANINPDAECWHLLTFTLTMDEGESVYFDDIEIIETATGKNVFTKGTFDYKTEQPDIKTDGIDTEAYGYADYWRDWSGEGKEVNVYGEESYVGETVAVKDAPDGSYVWAVGFKDKAVNGVSQFCLPWITPGRNYRISVNLKLTGSISKATLYTMVGNAADVQHVIFGHASDIYGDSAPDAYYYTTDWQTLEFDYSCPETADRSAGWAYFVIRLQAAANSGVMIDNIVIKDTAMGDAAPNLFPFASFEQGAAPDADWSSTAYYSNNNAKDLSFAENLSGEVGTLEYGIKTDVNIYENVYSSSDFDYIGSVVIDDNNLDVIRYEAERAFQKGYKVWLRAENFTSSAGRLYANWQTSLLRAAATVQNAAAKYNRGDDFEGVYFDEPHLYYASNAEFVTVTKYCRETLHKRTFANLKLDSFGASANVTLPGCAEYLTDVGYWCYSAEHVDSYLKNIIPAFEALETNVIKWAGPFAGRGELAETREDTLHILNSMLNSFRELKGFGGVMLYSIKQGYDYLVPDESGKAADNDMRNALIAVAAEFKGEKYVPAVINTDSRGVIVMNAGDTSEDIIGLFEYPFADKVSVSAEGMLKTGDTLSAARLTSTAADIYEIAVCGDVNGDGLVDIRDLISLKKLSANSAAATKAQLSAAGDTDGALSATELTALRKALIFG